MAHSRRLRYNYGQLYLNDGTHEYADENFHPVKPSYAGDLKYSVQSSDHNGWLKCDGRSVSRTLYAKLFEVIGTSFGSNDSETFKLPDCRGRVLGTIGTGSGLTARSLGAVVGTETHTLTVGEMPTHTHTSNAVGGSLGLATSDNLNTAGAGLDTTVGELNLYATPTALTINDAGGGGAHNNMQPTIFISNIFIFSY
jgi:microcystin-dependent protein